MIWGLTSGGWMSGLTNSAPDPYRARLELLAEHDLHAGDVNARALLEMEPGRREEIAGWLDEFDVHTVLGVGMDWFADDPEELKRGTERCIEAIETLAGMMRSTVCGTGIRRDYHHYSRDVTVEQQIDILSETMAPVAEAAWRAGCPLAIHKVTHFGTDLAELCRRVPHVRILLDTGNAFLAGECPVAAAEAAAPYTVAAHFKDHYAMPTLKPLGLRVRGAVPGSGDADLGTIYGILQKSAPEPDEMLMLMEIDRVDGLTQQQALEQALEFVRCLES